MIWLIVVFAAIVAAYFLAQIFAAFIGQLAVPAVALFILWLIFGNRGGRGGGHSCHHSSSWSSWN